MTDEVGADSEEAGASARSAAQIRAGRVGWILMLIVLLATALQVIIGVGFLLDGAFGGGLHAGEVTGWVMMVRILLAASIACCVLAVIAKRWILFSLALVISLVLVVLNLLQWNVGSLS